MKELGSRDDFYRDLDTNTNEDDIGVDAVFGRILAPDGQT